MAFFWGILMFLVGLFLIINTQAILRNMGRIWWAEKHLGTEGGTRLMYKLIGIGFIALGFLLITGLAGPLFIWAISPIVNIVNF
jgi:hypothetical protein